LILGAVAGSFIASDMSDFMGRLKGIFFSNFIMWVSFGMILTSPYKGGPLLFFSGCFVYGIAVGLFSFLTPKYITETAPLEISGKLGSLH
jgi:MFS family permease